MAFVQSSIAYSDGSLSNVASTALATSDGDTLCVGLGCHYAISDVAISDNYGNTWTPHPANPLASSSSSSAFAWVASNIAGGADHVVTITFTFASLICALIVHEYSGRASSSVIDASGSGVDASSTLSHSNGSVTSITAGDDVFAFCSTSLPNFVTESMTFGSGWTLPANSESTVFAGAVYQADVAPGTYTLDYTTPSGYACYGAGLLFALAPAGGGGQKYSYTASGGFQVGGSSAQTRAAARAARGGATLGGAAALVRAAVHAASGGTQIGGTASVSFNHGTQSYTYVATGGFLIGGGSASLRALSYRGAGGVLLGGTAALAFVRSEPLADGGMRLGGSAGYATHESVRTVIASGGMYVGGIAEVSFFSTTGTGRRIYWRSAPLIGRYTSIVPPALAVGEYLHRLNG